MKAIVKQLAGYWLANYHLPFPFGFVALNRVFLTFTHYSRTTSLEE
jgi:hypothetical protein